jgi:1-acyl-sn-glycerol-3-phosphate acyltransferase
VKPFRKGAAILSARLDAPMIPVAIDGASLATGPDIQLEGHLPWRAKRITVHLARRCQHAAAITQGPAH